MGNVVQEQQKYNTVTMPNFLIAIILTIIIPFGAR